MEPLDLTKYRQMVLGSIQGNSIGTGLPATQQPLVGPIDRSQVPSTTKVVRTNDQNRDQVMEMLAKQPENFRPQAAQPDTSNVPSQLVPQLGAAPMALPNSQPNNLQAALATPGVWQAIAQLGQVIAGPNNPINALGDFAIQNAQSQMQQTMTENLLAGRPNAQLGASGTFGISPDTIAAATRAAFTQRQEERLERQAAVEERLATRRIEQTERGLNQTDEQLRLRGEEAIRDAERTRFEQLMDLTKLEMDADDETWNRQLETRKVQLEERLANIREEGQVALNALRNSQKTLNEMKAAGTLPAGGGRSELENIELATRSAQRVTNAYLELQGQVNTAKSIISNIDAMGEAGKTPANERRKAEAQQTIDSFSSEAESYKKLVTQINETLASTLGSAPEVKQPKTTTGKETQMIMVPEKARNKGVTQAEWDALTPEQKKLALSQLQ